MYQPSSSLCIYHLQVYPYVYLSPFSQMTEKETGLNSSTAKLGFEASSDPRPFCALLSRFASFMREYVPHFEQHFPRCDALTTGIALIWNACWNSHSQAPSRPREAGAPGRPRGGGGMRSRSFCRQCSPSQFECYCFRWIQRKREMQELPFVPLHTAGERSPRETKATTFASTFALLAANCEIPACLPPGAQCAFEPSCFVIRWYLLEESNPRINISKT